MRGKTLILGQGYVASRLAQAWGLTPCGKKILSYQDALKIFHQYKPRVIINCIGYVGQQNVDDCESEPDQCLLANTLVPLWLGEIAYRYPMKLVHISSGCMYHYDYKKQKPLTEKQRPDYSNLFYSRTKIYAEQILNALPQQKNILIVRIRIPLDTNPHPRNLLTKLIAYKNVIDVPNAVTYIPDFIKALEHLLRINASGTFNVASKGGLRYPDLMDVYRQFVPGFKYRILPLKDLKRERTNLLLSVLKLEKTGFKVRPIKDVLHECVEAYVEKKCV